LLDIEKDKKILVIGGAGYIGSHMCKYLAQKGHQPIILDNLSNGHIGATKYGHFIQGSISDKNILKEIFSKYEILSVMHFAALCYVGESVISPAIYYQNNVVNTLNLLNEMIKMNINNFIFSSSCATYGEPIETPITELHPQNPINPYGRTKLIIEKILNDYNTAYGLNSISLRYFNASGADSDGEIGEDHKPETHLIPLAIQSAMGQRDLINIYGNDYPTKDGTCIRDYIHVMDIAQAHYLALKKILNDSKSTVYNLGNNRGYSVMEVIETVQEITGVSFPVKIVDRRNGDPAILFGSSEKAKKELNWKLEFSELHTIIETAWNWHKKHPDGY
jgi:UDP-glucose 4-epimerase